MATKLEQETVIRWDRVSDQADVWTANVAVRNRLQRRGFAMEVFGGGWRATIPQKAISIRSRAAVFATRAAHPPKKRGVVGVGTSE